MQRVLALGQVLDQPGQPGRRLLERLLDRIAPFFAESSAAAMLRLVTAATWTIVRSYCSYTAVISTVIWSAVTAMGTSKLDPGSTSGRDVWDAG